MSLKQSMQVSTVTLTVATTRHHHTDRDSGDAYHSIYTVLTVASEREGHKGAKALMYK